MRISVRDLQRGLTFREQRRADIDHAVYVRPDGATGLHVVEWPIGSGTEITTGSALQGKTFRPGTVVPLASHIGDSRKIIVGGPPAGIRGASAFPVDVGGPGDLTSIGVIAASPTTLDAGSSSEPITLTGFGFISSHTFEAVRMTSSGWAVDPLITVATVSIDDSETAQVTVTVDASAPSGYPISFRIVGTDHIGAHLISVTVPVVPISAYWGIFYKASTTTLYCWSYGADGSFIEEVDSQVVDLGTDLQPMNTFALVGETIEFTYNEDFVSPFPRKTFRWSPLTSTLEEYTSTIDPASDSSSNWHSKYSGVRSGSTWYRAQLSSFGSTSGSVVYQILQTSSSIRGNKDFGSTWDDGYTISKDIVGGGGWCAVGTLVMMDAQRISDSDPTLFVLDVSDKSTTIHNGYSRVGAFFATPTIGQSSCGVAISASAAVFLRNVTGQGWVAVLRPTDGSGDTQLWPDWDLTELGGGIGNVPYPLPSLVPGGAEISVYPFSGYTLVRTSSTTPSVSGSAPEVAVEAGPEGNPHRMLPRV